MRVSIIATAAIAAVIGVASTQAMAKPYKDPKSGCTFGWSLEEGWVPGITPVWSGKCKDGLASGPGTITLYRDGRAFSTWTLSYVKGWEEGMVHEVNFDKNLEQWTTYKHGISTGVGLRRNPDSSWEIFEITALPGGGTLSMPVGPAPGNPAADPVAYFHQLQQKNALVPSASEQPAPSGDPHSGCRTVEKNGASMLAC